MNSTIELQHRFEAAKARVDALMARTNGGDMSPAQQREVEAALDAAKGLKAQLDRARNGDSFTSAMDRGLGGLPIAAIGSGGSLGQQFLNSPTYKWLREHKGALPTGSWVTPASELMAATLTEDAASGGDLVVADTRPGIVPLPTRKLVMSDLIAQGTTDSNLISYMKETTFTNSADTVAEAAAKPESTLIFDAVTDPVRKIAHWLPVTEEMLEDVPALRSYLDARLRHGVQLTEDDQLLNGSVVAPDIIGILNRTGLTAAQARGADTNADAVYKQLVAVFLASGAQPTGVVLNPMNWQTVMLTKLATGEYATGFGPLSTPPTPTLWGLPVALTTSIAAGTGLVGDFRGSAQIFRKGGLRVEVSNSHSDFFIKNLVAIRAEERLALAVYRPAAFGTITGLN